MAYFLVSEAISALHSYEDVLEFKGKQGALVMSNFICFVITAAIVAIVFADTIPGLVLRAAFAAPLVWTGVIDVDTYNAFANPYGR